MTGLHGLIIDLDLFAAVIADASVAGGAWEMLRRFVGDQVVMAIGASAAISSQSVSVKHGSCHYISRMLSQPFPGHFDTGPVLAGGK